MSHKKNKNRILISLIGLAIILAIAVGGNLSNLKGESTFDDTIPSIQSPTTEEDISAPSEVHGGSSSGSSSGNSSGSSSSSSQQSSNSGKNQMSSAEISGSQVSSQSSSSGKSQTSSAKPLGSITVTTSSNPIGDGKAVAGYETLVARYKLSAEKEPFMVQEITFENDSKNDNPYENDAAIMFVVLRYPTSISTPTLLDGYSTASLLDGKATFTGVKVAVPMKEYYSAGINIEVSVATKDIGYGTNSGDQIEMDFKAKGQFKATGLKSQGTVTQNSSSSQYKVPSDIDANQIALYKSLATFEADDSEASPCSQTNLLTPGNRSLIYCFKATAEKAGDIGLHHVTLDVIPTLLQTGPNKGQLSETYGFELHEYLADRTILEPILAKGTWSNNKVALLFSQEDVITKGTTKYYALLAPIAFENSEKASTTQTRLRGDQAYADSSYAGSSSENELLWSDRSSGEHSYITYDWTNAYKVNVLPSDYLTLSEL